MLSNSGSHSEYFEELCALAASGQISEPEFVELSEHKQNCARCQSVYDDFVDLFHNKLPLADPELTGPAKIARPSLESSSYRERFITRARKEGIAVAPAVLPGTAERGFGSSWLSWLNFAQLAPLALALLVVAAGSLGYAWRQSNARYMELAAKFAALSGQIQPGVSSEPVPVHRPAPQDQPESRPLQFEVAQAPPVAVQPVISNEAELIQARQDYAAAAAIAKVAEERYQAAAKELEDVGGRLVSSNEVRRGLEIRLNSAEKERDQAKGDLRVANENLGKNVAMIADQSRRIEEQNVKLNAQIASRNRSNVLFEELREVRDQLLDLRSTDVVDSESNGKERKATGRIFYTGGKSSSLLFLASGLSKRADGKVFQVWGAHGENGTSPRRLGILEPDNTKSDLWSLSVNDASKLAGIDTVYVTLEKGIGSEKPADKHIMSAYLRQIPTKQ